MQQLIELCCPPDYPSIALQILPGLLRCRLEGEGPWHHRVGRWRSVGGAGGSHLYVLSLCRFRCRVWAGYAETKKGEEFSGGASIPRFGSKSGHNCVSDTCLSTQRRPKLPSGQKSVPPSPVSHQPYYHPHFSDPSSLSPSKYLVNLFLAADKYDLPLLAEHPECGLRLRHRGRTNRYGLATLLRSWPE